jgi:hypothetical protein
MLLLLLLLYRRGLFISMKFVAHLFKLFLFDQQRRTRCPIMKTLISAHESYKISNYENQFIIPITCPA